MVMQGVGAVLGGGLAQLLGRGTTGVAWTIALLAVVSLAVTASLTRGLRRSGPGADQRSASIRTSTSSTADR
jgi:hypothetical protein